MNVFKKTWALTAGLVTATALTVGCQDQLTQDDVNEERQEAREAVHEARQDMAETHTETHREIAMVEQDRQAKVAELQSDLRDPNVDVAEVHREIAEVNREADAKVAELRQDAAEDTADVREDAQEQVNEAEATRMKYEAQQARDAYAKQADLALSQIDKDIETLRARGDALLDTQQERFNQSMDVVDERRDEVDEALDSLKSAEAENWKSFQDEVDQAMQQLKSAYDAAAAEIKG